MEKDQLSLREVLKLSVWTLRFNFTLFPLLSLANIVGSSVQYLDTIIYTYFFAYFIDSAISIAAKDGNFADMYPMMIVFFLYYLFNIALSNLMSYVERIYGLESRFKYRQRLQSKINELGIQQLENSEVENKLHRVSENMVVLSNYSERVFDIFSRSITIVFSGIVLFAKLPILLPVIVLSLIPRILIHSHFLRIEWKFNVQHTEEFRKANEDSTTITTVKKLHEVTINNSADFFSRKFTQFFQYYIGTIGKIVRKRSIITVVLELMTMSVIFLGLGYFLNEFLLGIITIGVLTFHFRNLQTFVNQSSILAQKITSLWESSVRIQDSYDIFEMKPLISDGKVKLPKFDSPPVVTIENVVFTYPNAKEPSIKNMSLKINPGEKIAIVGHNGAGKTTLVRLLMRLYEVSSGSIMINDINIRDIAIKSWYRNVGVLFQEYNMHDHLTLKENIAVGDVSKKATKDMITLALKNADALSFTEKYPEGLDQVLSERYKGGIRPSTGQWQKIAIARFLYRDSPFVIFDEPTASIDPVSEHNIFNNIYEYFANKTVIIISHRFSTVRRADKIIVMDDGQIKEVGSHEELMNKNGIYANAFNLQAEGYKS